MDKIGLYNGLETLPRNGESLPSDDAHKSLSMKDRGIYFMSTGFDASSARDIVNWILESNFDTKRQYDNLTLIINSPGGDLNSAFAIIDCMRGSALPVHTIGLGLIASCGILTFMSGEKGHRTLTPNTSILSHQWSWGSHGKSHELFAAKREFDLTEERMIRHYQRCTGLTENVIKEKLLPAHDVWLSAEEAKAFGIADHIKDLG